MTEELDPAKYREMICKIIKRFANRGMSEEDLIAEGYLGLTHAWRKFDEKRGDAKLSTYAYPWILKTVQRAIEDQVPLVSVPSNVQQRIKYKNSKSHASAAAIEDGRRALRSHVNEATLEGSNDGASLSSLAFAPRNSDLDQRIAALDIAVLMRGLPALDAEVIRLLYGLDGQAEMNAAQVGRHLGKSKQWILQVETRALDKLRNRARRSA